MRRLVIALLVGLLGIGSAEAAGTFSALPNATVPLGSVPDFVPLDQGTGCPTLTTPCTTSKAPSIRVGQPVVLNCSSLGSPFSYEPCIDTSTSLPTLKAWFGGNWAPIGTYDTGSGIWTPPVGGGRATVASAGTADLGSVPQAAVTVSGTTTINSFGSSAPTGTIKFLTFSGALTLTYNATSLILPSAASITTAAGDTAVAEALGSGNWVVLVYQPVSGSSLVLTKAAIIAALGYTPLNPANNLTDVASAATSWTNLGGGSAGKKNLGVSVNDPGSGSLEMLIPTQTVTGAGRTYGAIDLFKATTRSNSGSAMADSLPPSSTTGLANGTRIIITNADASASDSLTAGAGTSLLGASSFVLVAGRQLKLEYDIANTNWRDDGNTSTLLLGNNATLTNPTITGGTDDNTIIGGNTPAAGTFTALGGANLTVSGSYTGNGTIPNAALANNSITVGSTSIALGGTASTIAGLTLTTPVLGVATATSINGFSICETQVTVETSGSGTFTTPTCGSGVLPDYIEVRLVGGGGGGGASGPSAVAGGNGGNTTIGTLTGGGGGGGPENGSGGGAGGSASLGSGPSGLPVVGATGSPLGATTTASAGGGGTGGASPLGGAGAGGATGNAGGSAQSNSGSGGGGPGTTGSVAGAGGGGAGGYVDGFITSPGSSYSYAVGAGGTAGSAGSGGLSGGTGGTGSIIIISHWL